jgi:hypothetical protein
MLPPLPILARFLDASVRNACVCGVRRWATGRLNRAIRSAAQGFGSQRLTADASAFNAAVHAAMCGVLIDCIGPALALRVRQLANCKVVIQVIQVIQVMCATPTALHVGIVRAREAPEASASSYAHTWYTLSRASERPELTFAGCSRYLCVQQPPNEGLTGKDPTRLRVPETYQAIKRPHTPCRRASCGDSSLISDGGWRSVYCTDFCLQRLASIDRSGGCKVVRGQAGGERSQSHN